MIALQKGTHNERWLRFMSKKFGKPYKVAFLIFREQEKKRVLEATEKIFDNKTLAYVEGLCSNDAQVEEILNTFRKDFEAMTQKEREEYSKKHGFDLGTPDDEKSL